MLGPLLRILCTALATLALEVSSASAQQFVAPQGQSLQLPYGQSPLLQVAPDGAVHLDGPYSQYSSPRFTTPAGAVIGQQAQATTAWGQGMNQFSNWLRNNPIPLQFKHRHGLYGDFLFLRPRNTEVAYALPIDGVVAVGAEVPVGPVALVDQTYQPGVRAGGVFRINDGASIRGQYSYFRSEATDSATILPGDVLRPLVVHPNTFNAATDVLDASARQVLDFDLVDIDYRGLIAGCESCQGRCAYMVNYLLGGRYAQLEQGFSSSFDVLNTRTVNTAVDFDGGGIRLGIEGERHSTTRGFFVYGSGVSNLMVGEFKANFRQADSLNVQEAATSWVAGRVVPTIDLEMGMGWVGPRRRLKVSAGYMVSTWFNMVKTEDWIHAVHTSNFNDMSGILTFDGLVARASWEF